MTSASALTWIHRTKIHNITHSTCPSTWALTGNTRSAVGAVTAMVTGRACAVIRPLTKHTGPFFVAETVEGIKITGTVSAIETGYILTHVFVFTCSTRPTVSTGTGECVVVMVDACCAVGAWLTVAEISDVTKRSSISIEAITDDMSSCLSTCTTMLTRRVRAEVMEFVTFITVG